MVIWNASGKGKPERVLQECHKDWISACALADNDSYLVSCWRHVSLLELYTQLLYWSLNILDYCVEVMYLSMYQTTVLEKCVSQWNNIVLGDCF